MERAAWQAVYLRLRWTGLPWMISVLPLAIELFIEPIRQRHFVYPNLCRSRLAMGRIAELAFVSRRPCRISTRTFTSLIRNWNGLTFAPVALGDRLKNKVASKAVLRLGNAAATTALPDDVKTRLLAQQAGRFNDQAISANLAALPRSRAESGRLPGEAGHSGHCGDHCPEDSQKEKTNSGLEGTAVGGQEASLGREETGKPSTD